MPTRKFHEGEISILKYLETDLFRPTSSYKNADGKPETETKNLFKHK